jgi:hypothetical protein
MADAGDGVAICATVVAQPPFSVQSEREGVEGASGIVWMMMAHRARGSMARWWRWSGSAAFQQRSPTRRSIGSFVRFMESSNSWEWTRRRWGRSGCGCHW